EVIEIEQNQSIESKTVLRIKGSGEIIQQVTSSNPEDFMWSGSKEQDGLGDGMFFIIRIRKFFGKEWSKLVFQSCDFKQASIGNDRFRYLDNLSKNQYVGDCDAYIADGKNRISVCELIVENHEVI